MSTANKRAVSRMMGVKKSPIKGLGICFATYVLQSKQWSSIPTKIAATIREILQNQLNHLGSHQLN